MVATPESVCSSPAGAPSKAAVSSGVPTVEPALTKQWLDSGVVVLIDVREQDEHAGERIAGAISLPLSRWDAGATAAMAAAVSPGKVVMHCKGGVRSADATRQTLAAGAGANVLSLAGGLDAWKKAGFPVVAGARRAPMNVMRQVQLTIGVCVLIASVLAYFVHPAFLGLAAFFGAGLTFAGATGICALANIMGKMPWNKGCGGCAATGRCGSA